MRQKIILTLVLLLIVSSSSVAYQFVEFFDMSGRAKQLSWASGNMLVDFFVKNRAVADISVDQTVGVLRASYETWESLESSTIAFNFGGITEAEPFVMFDFINTLGFSEVGDPEFEDAGVLGITTWVFDTRNGEIVESDIIFNSEIPWSVAPSGQSGRFDLQSVATHEIGHFLGLGHSATGVMETRNFRRKLLDGSAVMYPFAFPPGSVIGRSVTSDELVGASVLYPSSAFSEGTGSMSGQITKNGQGLAFAYVNVLNPFTGETIGFFADADGNYRIEGLKAGPYTVRVGPIADPTTPAHYGFPEQLINLDYSDAIYENGRAEVVPRQDTSGVNIEVTP